MNVSMYLVDGLITEKPEFNQASRSNYQFTGNTRDSGVCYTIPQNSGYRKFQRTNNPASITIKLQGRKKNKTLFREIKEEPIKDM